MKTYFSRIECILKEVEVASCTDTVIVFASVGKKLVVSNNRSCKENIRSKENQNKNWETTTTGET